MDNRYVHPSTDVNFPLLGSEITWNYVVGENQFPGPSSGPVLENTVSPMRRVNSTLPSSTILSVTSAFQALCDWGSDLFRESVELAPPAPPPPSPSPPDPRAARMARRQALPPVDATPCGSRGQHHAQRPRIKGQFRDSLAAPPAAASPAGSRLPPATTASPVPRHAAATSAGAQPVAQPPVQRSSDDTWAGRYPAWTGGSLRAGISTPIGSTLIPATPGLQAATLHGGATLTAPAAVVTPCAGVDPPGGTVSSLLLVVIPTELW
jgi:hypothetical protein